jgi:hypothetical protein
MSLQKIAEPMLFAYDKRNFTAARRKTSRSAGHFRAAALVASGLRDT